MPLLREMETVLLPSLELWLLLVISLGHYSLSNGQRWEQTTTAILHTIHTTWKYLFQNLLHSFIQYTLCVSEWSDCFRHSKFNSIEIKRVKILAFDGRNIKVVLRQFLSCNIHECFYSSSLLIGHWIFAELLNLWRSLVSQRHSRIYCTHIANVIHCVCYLFLGDR